MMDEFDVTQGQGNDEANNHNQESELRVLAHQPPDNAVDGGKDSTQENSIGNHADFSQQRQT